MNEFCVRSWWGSLNSRWIFEYRLLVEISAPTEKATSNWAICAGDFRISFHVMGHASWINITFFNDKENIKGYV